MPIVTDLSLESYHAGDGVGASTLARVLRSPAHSRVPIAPSPAMELGTAFHVAMEIGAAWRERYAIKPADHDGRTRAGKEWVAAHADRPTLSADDADRVDAAAAATCAVALGKQTIGDALIGAHFERSHFSTDELTGLLCKVRPDVETHGMIIDWKMTTDAREHAFAGKVEAYGYDLQAAYYLDHVAEPADLFVFVVVERDAPHGVQAYYVACDSDEHLIGRAKWRRALTLYAHCAVVCEWPGYDPTPKRLLLKPWAYKEAI